MDQGVNNIRRFNPAQQRLRGDLLTFPYLNFTGGMPAIPMTIYTRPIAQVYVTWPVNPQWRPTGLVFLPDQFSLQIK